MVKNFFSTRMRLLRLYVPSNKRRRKNFVETFVATAALALVLWLWLIYDSGGSGRIGELPCMLALAFVGAAMEKMYSATLESEYCGGFLIGIPAGLVLGWLAMLASKYVGQAQGRPIVPWLVIYTLLLGGHLLLYKVKTPWTAKGGHGLMQSVAIFSLYLIGFFDSYYRALPLTIVAVCAVAFAFNTVGGTTMIMRRWWNMLILGKAPGYEAQE